MRYNCRKKISLYLHYSLLFCLALAGIISTPTAFANRACPNVAFDDFAKVRYVHDGDTLHLKDGRKIRLIGINTPELARNHKPAEPFANDAKAALNSLLNKNKSISLVYGANKKDNYGRILAHIFTSDRQNVQVELLKQGVARAIHYPPNTQFSTCYHEAENNARCNNEKLWKNSTVLDAKKLNKRNTGFHLVKGQVKNININKKGVWLNLSDKLTVGIRAHERSLFDTNTINSWLNQTVVVRGWLNNSKQPRSKQSESKQPGPFYMRVRHPLSIQLSTTFDCR